MGCSPPPSWYEGIASRERELAKKATEERFSQPEHYMGKLPTCWECGAAVNDKPSHARWHRKLDPEYQSSLLE